MDVCLQHVLISNDPKARRWDTWDESMRPSQELRLLAAFSQYAQFREELEINWPRTFASQGLVYGDYALVSGSRSGNRLLYRFRRITDALPPSAAMPQTVNITWDQSETGPRQGDCLMFRRSVPRLCFEIASDHELVARPEYSLMFGERYLTELACAQVLGERCFDPKSTEIFNRKILKRWTPRSFIFISSAVF